MAITRTRRTFNSSKPKTAASSIPKSTTKVTASGQDYSVTGNAKSDAINLAKANAIGAKKSAARGEAYDPSAFSADMGKNPIAPGEGMDIPETPQTALQPGQAPSSIAQQNDVITDNVTKQSFTRGANGTYVPTTQKEQYAQALQGLSGTQAPQEASQGLSAIQGAMQTPEQEGTSLMGGIMETDNNFDSILTDYDSYFAPETQRKSLLQEYKSMSKSLGIDEINEELINAERIIDGTEDDLRSEITAAGGFGTESQVQALANARNKSLIKNYNALLSSRDNAMTQLSTMMNLSIQDRQMAEAEFDRKMNFAFKVQEFQQKATDNARTTYLSLGDKMGWDTLLSQASPYEKGIMQKTLGLTSGGLQQLALRSQQDRLASQEESALDLDIKRSQLETDKAQRANIYSQITERNNTANSYGTISGKPQNATQSAANGYADRLNEASIVLDTLGGNFTGKLDYGGKLPNVLQSGDRQSYEQAKKNFVTAVLRRESGASIAPTEFQTAEEIYFPVAGDTKETIEQKEKTRNTVINNFYREADVNRPVLPGQIIESDGKKYKVGMDGETITELK